MSVVDNVPLVHEVVGDDGCDGGGDVVDVWNSWGYSTVRPHPFRDSNDDG